MSTENTNNQPIVDDDPIVAGFVNDLNSKNSNPEPSSETEPTVADDNQDGVANQNDSQEDNNQDNTGDSDNDADKNTADTEPQQFDLNKYLEQSSDGLFKSEDEFKAGLQKVKEYENLQKQINELKSEKENIFANKEIETLNRLHKEGKTGEQIEEYMRLSKVNLDEVDAKEVLVQREIQNGKTRVIAEKFIERKYGLDKIVDEELLTASELEEQKSELAYIDELMKSDANPVRKELKEQLASLSTTESPSEKALKEAAAKQAYQAKLDPFVNQLASSFPKQLVVGDESTGQLTFDVPADLLEQIKTEAKEYFLDQEVNEQSVNEFITSQKALWLYNNQKQILESIKQQAEVATEKRIRAEYENPNGLPKQTNVPVTQEVDRDKILMDIANDMGY